MSKSQLADAAGVSRKTFSEWLVPFPARSELSPSALSMAEPMSSGVPNLSCPRTRPDSNGSCSSNAPSSTIASTSSKRSTRTSKRPSPCAKKSKNGSPISIRNMHRTSKPRPSSSEPL